MAELGRQAGECDILVNNAGSLIYAPLLDLSAEQIDSMFRVNVLAAIQVNQVIGAAMVERKRGHMVIMTSLSARNVNQFAVAYAATKHALSAVARGMRLEFKAAGVKVTEIAPGMVDTDIRNSSTHPGFVAQLKTRPFGPLSPEDVAEAVVYAVSTSPNCCPDLIELRPTPA